MDKEEQALLEKEAQEKINHARLRAGKVAEAYYSHSAKAIRLLHNRIDKIIEIHSGEEPQNRWRQTIEHLARCLAETPVSRHVLTDDRQRREFFIDLLFEKYHEDNLLRTPEPW